MPRRPLPYVVLLAGLLAALALPSAASAATANGFVIAREHAVSQGRVDLRVRLTTVGRRALRTDVPVVIVRIRPSQLRNLTGTFRSPVRFLRLGDRVQLVGARRSGSRIRVRQVREKANASLPTFSRIDREDVLGVRDLVTAQRAATAARGSGDAARRIKTLEALKLELNDVATTNDERAIRQQYEISLARSVLPTGGRRAAALRALDARLARPASEVALRVGVAQRLRAQALALDTEIVRVGSGTGAPGPEDMLGSVIETVNGILGTLDPVVNGIGDAINDATGGAVPSVTRRGAAS